MLLSQSAAFGEPVAEPGGDGLGIILAVEAAGVVEAHLGRGADGVARTGIDQASKSRAISELITLKSAARRRIGEAHVDLLHRVVELMLPGHREDGVRMPLPSAIAVSKRRPSVLATDCASLSWILEGRTRAVVVLLGEALERGGGK